LYPLEELDPPEAARRQFANLYREGHPLSAPRAHTREDLMREKVQLTPRPWIDRITGDDPGHLAGIKNVTATEAFFNDHFPRKPVLPGVVTLECLIGLAARLAERELEAKGLSRLRPVLQQTTKTKFRMFLQPGDQLVMDARLTEFSESFSTIKVAGQVGGKRAAMITVHFTHLDRDSYLEQFIF
ncbi:MAG: hypothetical protein GY868_12210, partial [Deltaproteobacteria bacterium]|nr:hypothetical protein [Deltaproteobacteria bacterium]